MSNQAQRRDRSKLIRFKAAELAFDRGLVVHRTNGDEQRFPNRIASFTKGLPHDVQTGILDKTEDFDLLIKSVDTGRKEDQVLVPLGPPDNTPFLSKLAREVAVDPVTGKKKLRAWESSGAGLIFDLEGADAQSVTMPPAPTIDSEELATEMSEVYSMALLRDAPFIEFDKCDTKTGKLVARAISWINETINCPNAPRGRFDVQTVFRGLFPGETIGPLVSQFLLVGTKGIDPERPRKLEEGLVQYGSITIDQRIVATMPNLDFMTTWAQYIDVQNAADVRGAERYLDKKRFICKARDLATYVHHDALYEAYLNACLILLDTRAKFDEGIPFQLDDSIDRQSGFASWGGPHILTLVTEVATRALKAVRFQKFNTHRRLRPENLGGLIDRWLNTKDPAVAGVEPLASRLSDDLLQSVAEHNFEQNMNPDRKDDCDNGHEQSYLLPMAFGEGSPMHPSYGAGHAAVAGASVTILKAWFDTEQKLSFAFEASADGEKLVRVPEFEGKLKLEHELNKLAGNISIGRNHAGVHYFTDYIESALLGEQIAISILEEQASTYPEDFHMTIPTFRDGNVIIKKKGNFLYVTRNGNTTRRSIL